MSAPRYASVALAIAVTVTCFVQKVKAQSIWLPPATASQIRLEALKPVFDLEGVGFWTSAWYLSGFARVGPRVALEVELPFSMYEEEGVESQSTLGNPYLGVVYGAQDRTGPIVEAGGRLPILSDERAADNIGAVISGWVADVNRMESFAPDMAALRLRAGGYLVNNPQAGMAIRLMAGGQAWIPTSGGDGEVALDADLGLWNLGPQIAVGAVLSLKTLVTESDLSFSERSELQLGLVGSVRWGQVEPGIHAHLPLGNEGLIGLGEVIDVVLGVHCTVHLVP